MHKFSMLQRFRQSKDFRAPDKYKPKVIDDETNLKEQESEWYKNNVQTEQQRKEAHQKEVEKGRYLKALKVLVKENGKKMNPENGDIPALCSCGAQYENIKTIKNG